MSNARTTPTALRKRIAALREAGWRIETSWDGGTHNGECRWRQGVIRENRENLALLVELCEQHAARLASSDLKELEAHAGLSNL